MLVSTKTKNCRALVRVGLIVAALALAWPSLALAQSPRLAAQSHALEAAQASIGAAGQLPDPKLVLGVDNLPVDGPDRYSLTRDFMTMRRIGYM